MKSEPTMLCRGHGEALFDYKPAPQDAIARANEGVGRPGSLRWHGIMFKRRVGLFRLFLGWGWQRVTGVWGLWRMTGDSTATWTLWAAMKAMSEGDEDAAYAYSRGLARHTYWRLGIKTKASYDYRSDHGRRDGEDPRDA